MGYKQAQNRKKRLIKTYNKTKTSYGSGVWYDADRGFYYKYYASNTPGYTKTLKRRSNKKIRRSRELINHSAYKRVYDYRWILF